VSGASGNDGAIVNIRRQGSEAPLLSKTEKGEDVYGRQDGGQRGALGGAVVEDDLREGFAVEGQHDPTVCEERSDPLTQRRGEAQDAENVDQAADM